MADDIYLTQKDLIDNLLNNLPAGFTADKVQCPNAPFTTPKNEKWLRVASNLNPKENVQAGGYYKRQYGIFTIDIFHPSGSGDLAALEDFNAISLLYENQNVGNAKCEAVSAIIINNNDNWFRVQTDVVFYFEGA